MVESPDWAGASGDVWSRRWRDTDRALAPVGVALDEAIAAAAPPGPFRALDIGCGPGTTALVLSDKRADASILGCDVSSPLIDVARQRSGGRGGVEFIVSDALQAARARGPFELMFSRHGVMFFADPAEAFRDLRSGALAGAGLVFSCFQSWDRNPWASQLADAAAERHVPAPGREPSGFAFADPNYVRSILADAGWVAAEPVPICFDYVAGEGASALDDALGLLGELGPAARVIDSLEGSARTAALERVRTAIEARRCGDQVSFPAAAWLWSASAG